MEPIYPITALQKKPAEVKAAAAEGIVRITENGMGAYVFASEEAYERKLREVAAQAMEDALIVDAIERGRADMAAGRYITGTEAFLAEMERRAALYGNH